MTSHDAIAAPVEPISPVPRPVLGVSVCVWRGDAVLLVQRGRAPAKGLWAPVGGRVEWGETLAEAARREVLEETAVVCDIVGFSQLREMIEPGLRDQADHQGGHHVVLAVFAARYLEGDATAGDDADAAEWVRLEALADYPLVPGVVPYIEASRRLIEGDRA